MSVFFLSGGGGGWSVGNKRIQVRGNTPVQMSIKSSQQTLEYAKSAVIYTRSSKYAMKFTFSFVDER